MNHSEQEVRIRKRLAWYLERQRQGLLGYLDVLDHQGAAIRSGDADRLEHYAALEQEIVGHIASLRRAIEPLQELHRRSRAPEEPAIVKLGRSLGRLREQALSRNRENQCLLRERLGRLSQEIREVSRRRKPAPSPYAGIGEPRLVDIRS